MQDPITIHQPKIVNDTSRAMKKQYISPMLTKLDSPAILNGLSAGNDAAPGNTDAS